MLDYTTLIIFILLLIIIYFVYKAIINNIQSTKNFEKNINNEILNIMEKLENLENNNNGNKSINENIVKIHDLCNKNNELLLINKQKILSKENFNNFDNNNFENYTNSPNTENCFKKNTCDDLETLNKNILTLESTESINLNDDNNTSVSLKNSVNENNTSKSKSNKSENVENDIVKEEIL
jgi:hypothetical protein